MENFEGKLQRALEELRKYPVRKGCFREFSVTVNCSEVIVEGGQLLQGDVLGFRSVASRCEMMREETVIDVKRCRDDILAAAAAAPPPPRAPLTASQAVLMQHLEDAVRSVRE